MRSELTGLIVILAIPTVPLIMLGIWYLVQKVRRRGMSGVEDEEAPRNPGPERYGF